jgi:hypothetical protein
MGLLDSAEVGVASPYRAERSCERGSVAIMLLGQTAAHGQRFPVRGKGIARLTEVPVGDSEVVQRLRQSRKE